MLKNRLEQFRLKRQKVYERLFSARILSITGLLVMPAMLFNPVIQYRVAQFLFFWFLCWLAGKKNRTLMTVFMIVSIVAFNLMPPHGRILYTLGNFRITLGALMTGISRAVTLQGLIMLSKLSIRRDLKIPGGFGDIIGESFKYYANILDSKNRITRKNLIEDIDNLMINLSEEEIPQDLQSSTQTKPAGFVILAIVVILSWLPWFFA